ncbi:MAG: hypothetical protein KDC73_09160 [Ignavibacteriae bacterium]|nr:hypothetical protein [Ignavibacteriota bacterium]MCB9242122.1 hypothetical protein [Ignavibacteriales bacterium]
MIKELRDKYNREFSETRYNEFIEDLNRKNGTKIEFRIAETPIFLPNDLKKRIFKGIDDIVGTLTRSDYLSKVDKAVPSILMVPNETPYTETLSIDFAICKDDDGNLVPKLIEMQGFPSLYFYQLLLNREYREFFDIPGEMENYFSGLDEEGYIAKMRETIVGDTPDENVILLEIEPQKQKTYIDFVMTERMLGINHVCISDVIKEDRKLFYNKNGKKIPIERIYNRVIFDELLARKDIDYKFRFQDDLDVKWVPHPNWFFKISKYSLPFLKSEVVPEAEFLSDFTEYPPDLENYILKPLFSFAGSGVVFDVTPEILDAIYDKSSYILQKKIEYTPVIETMDIPAKAEIRIMMIWDKEKETYIPVINLVRLGKGKMMGVDFNKNKTWVGSSIGYFEPD